MRCEVAETGDLDKCSIIQEAPLGLGFGAATLRVSNRFKMKPTRLDGAAIGGGVVIVPMTWRPAESPGSAKPFKQPTDLAGRPPTPAAIAKARRLVEALSLSEQLKAAGKAIADQLASATAGLAQDPHAAEQQKAIEAIRVSTEALAPTITERLAVSFAAHLSEAELSESVAFLTSPAGRAMKAEQVRMASNPQEFDLGSEFAQEAKRRFCSQVDCGSDGVAVSVQKDEQRKAAPRQEPAGARLSGQGTTPAARK